jgi:predicted lipoprotein with Yx(FWY)xxD motif
LLAGSVAVICALLASAGAVGIAPPVGALSTTTTTAVAKNVPFYEVKTGVVHGLGRVLVDGQGFTLYVFAPDKHSGSSKCYSRCAQAWPPLVLPTGVSRAPAGPGVKARLLGSTKRKDGTVEITYDKWPLYTWVIDSAPGDATGQDVNNLGGKWYVITPAGRIVTRRP